MKEKGGWRKERDGGRKGMNGGERDGGKEWTKKIGECRLLYQRRNESAPLLGLAGERIASQSAPQGQFSSERGCRRWQHRPAPHL